MNKFYFNSDNYFDSDDYWKIFTINKCEDLVDKKKFGGGIDRVLFNGRATIVFWKNGDKTVVKCCEGDTFDKEKGLMLALVKYICGNDNSYHKLFKKYIYND